MISEGKRKPLEIFDFDIRPFYGILTTSGKLTPSKSSLKEIAMTRMMRTIGFVAGGVMILVGCASTEPPRPSADTMTFFVTSAGPGKGADLGGVEGADQHCQSLAKAAGAGNRIWHAYLSTQASALNDPKFVNARDRIGAGPWQNANGIVIARNVEELHSASNNVTRQTALDEKGQLVNGHTEK